MLEHTLQRAEKLIPVQNLLVIIAKEHLHFAEVRRQIASRPRECVVIQPANRDTGPGILLPLIHIYKRYPDAMVAVFPSDHFILEEDIFMQHVDRAFQVVASDGSRIVLLAMEPNGPDPEYGYIVPGERIENSALDSIRRVELFVEKPGAAAAKKIIRSGALWNTLVLVFRCKTLLNAIESMMPQLHRSFQPILEAIGRPDEQRVIENVYQKLPSLNFSEGVLEVLPSEHRPALAVLPVPGVTWSDWGTSARLTSTLHQLGKSIHPQQERRDRVQKALPASPEKGLSQQIKNIQ
jgi:mannose-1-phosphate guanylyltransferase